MVSGASYYLKNKTRILWKISICSRSGKNSSRIQGVKKHRIPDPVPQHCNFIIKNWQNSYLCRILNFLWKKPCTRVGKVNLISATNYLWAARSKFLNPFSLARRVAPPAPEMTSGARKESSCGGRLDPGPLSSYKTIKLYYPVYRNRINMIRPRLLEGKIIVNTVPVLAVDLSSSKLT
jgi:hypothetical protein